MTDIELASPAEIIALKLQWEHANGHRCTTPQGYVKKTSRGGQRYYKRGPGEYVEEVKLERERISADYKKSEEERRLLRPKRSKSDDKWDKVWKEKHEDPKYYGVRV